MCENSSTIVKSCCIDSTVSHIKAFTFLDLIFKLHHCFRIVAVKSKNRITFHGESHTIFFELSPQSLFILAKLQRATQRASFESEIKLNGMKWKIVNARSPWWKWPFRFYLALHWSLQLLANWNIFSTIIYLFTETQFESKNLSEDVKL